MAVEAGATEAAAMLLDRGADVNISDHMDNFPLMAGKAAVIMSCLTFVLN